MKTVQLQSEVGKDGVLALRIPLGSDEAGHRVRVTVEPIAKAAGTMDDRGEWHQFIEETYGSCAGLGLERPDQGEFESRESIE
jgi:hypothetical protein